MTLFHLYRTPALSAYKTAGLLTTAQQTVCHAIHGIATELCFNVAAEQRLTSDEMRLLRWLLAETFEPEQFSDKSFLNPPSFAKGGSGGDLPYVILEVGPRMNFTTAWSTNAF